MKEGTQFVTILDFMVDDLELSGNELIAYACIYGFTMNGGWFEGSASYISRWCGCSKKTVYNVLKKLEERGLIERREKVSNGVKVVDYRCVISSHLGKKFPYPTEKISLPPTEKISHHIDIVDIDKDIDREKREKKKPQRPTLDQCREYAISKHLNVNPDKFFAYFEAGDWHDSRGKPVKNWKQKMITWDSHAEKPSANQEKLEMDMDVFDAIGSVMR